MLALMFQVGPDRVAVDVRRVREVIPRVRLTPATGAPAWVAGVFVYRGLVVPVVDLFELTGTGECPPHLSSRIVLVPFPAGSDNLVGLLATRVADIRELSTPLPTSEGLAAGRVGLGPALADGAGIIRILDPDALLAAAGLTLAPASLPGAGP
jgi:chemotaxis-related protein WspB